MFTLGSDHVLSSRVGNHTHDPSSIQVIGRKSVTNSITRKAEDDIDERPAKLISKELEEQSDMVSVLTHRDITYIRNNIHSTILKYHPKLPKSAHDVHLAVNAVNTDTIKNEEFLLKNDLNMGLIIFSTESNLRHLCGKDIVLMDGTFEFAPTFFLQLFTNHGMYIPLVFCLLKDKKMATYINCLDCVKLECSNRDMCFKPKTFVVDFEVAVQGAIHSIFSQSEIVGCRFHLAQAWLFWACCCLVSWIGSAMLMKSSYESFMTSPVKFVVEAGYWNWQTNFPSVTVCQTNDKEKFRNISKQLTGELYTLEDVYRTIVYFRSDASAIKNMCIDVDGAWDEKSHCPLNNYSSLSNMLRGSCEEVFTWCYWNDRPFNCCDEFQPLDTEYGTCYSINNYNTLQKPGAMNLLTNRSIKQPNMTLRFAVPVQVFLHSEIEVPSWNLLDNKFRLSPHKSNRILFTVKEMENEPGVRDVKLELRNCRFPDENPLQIYKYYSQNGCLVECRRDLQLRLCNCSHHLMPGTNLATECDGFGMQCLNKYKQQISNEVGPWDARDEDLLLCDCLPSCHAMEVDTIPSTRDVKLFWFGWCLFAWWAALYLIQASWNAFRTNAISFSVETERNTFSTPFPSLTVCERPHRILSSRRFIEKQDSLPEDIITEDALFEIAYFEGKVEELVSSCTDRKCFDEPYDVVMKSVRMPCEEFFVKCSWSEQEFDCCKYFRVLDTELGPCFTINSIYTGAPWMDLNSNMSTGVREMEIRANWNFRLYMHSPQGLAQLSTDQSTTAEIHMGKFVSVQIAETQVVNEEGMHDLDPEQRKCRFSDENYLTVYDHYSYDACIVECRKRAQLEICNCTTHFTPNTKKEEFCDVPGLDCISHHGQFSSGFINLTPRKEGEKDRLYCPCMLNCDVLEVKQIHTSTSNIKNQSVAMVKVKNNQLLTERFRRIIVRGHMDLVVNIGGTLGLLVGASLLSLVELIHYFVLPCIMGPTHWKQGATHSKTPQSNEIFISPDLKAPFNLQRRRTVNTGTSSKKIAY